MGNNERSLIRTAELYYEEGLSQNAIAELLGTSRASISRMLDEARECGIVEIIVHTPVSKNSKLSVRLREKFGLRDAVVVAGGSLPERALKSCGEAAASLLETILGNNMTLGIVWGRAIQFCCDAISTDLDYHNVHVAQMVGCLGDGSSNLGGLDLSMKIAKKLNGTYSNIYAPVIIGNETVYSYLMNDRQIKMAIDRAQKADIILSGIGLPSDDHSSMFRAGSFTPEERQDLIAKGGKAMVLSRWLDRDGKVLSCPGHYVVATPMETMRHAAWSIGICSAADRAEAVLATLRGGYLNALVVDESLALALLDDKNVL